MPSSGYNLQVTFFKTKFINLWKMKTRDDPDTVYAGYPAGRVSGESNSRIPDIRLGPDTRYPARFLYWQIYFW
jgi:hypothetical protein